MPALLRKYLDKFLVGLVVLSVGVLAFMHDGVAAAEVDLNDGGVWVTNGAKNLVGHLNYESQTLEGGLRTASGKFGLTQSGTDVVVESDGLVQPLDTAAVAFMGEAVTTGLRVAHGGDLVLISDPGDGSVWARSVQESATFNAAAEPNLEVKGAAAAVGTGGTGYVVDNEAKVYRVKGSGSDTAAEEIGKLGAPLQQDATLTVVGDTLVALDGHNLRMDDVSVSVAKDGRAARIEAPRDKVGSVSFAYQASDGIDLGIVSKIQVDIRQAEVNDAPEWLRKNTICVSARAIEQYLVLPDCFDPNGDTVYLENAVREDGMEVTWRPDAHWWCGHLAPPTMRRSVDISC